MDCPRFGREAELVQDGVHEVAGAVSSEGATGAVGSVGARSKAEDEHACAGIAEARYGTCPVLLVLVSAAAGLADSGAVGAQARAELAGDDLVANEFMRAGLDGRQTAWGGAWAGGFHECSGRWEVLCRIRNIEYTRDQRTDGRGLDEFYGNKTRSVRQRLRRFSRSGWMTPLLVLVLNLALGAAYWEHGRGNLHKLKQRIATEHTEVQPPRPGGQDPIVLTRERLMGDSAPEFTSMTLLPGRGMNVLQIRVFVPGRGEIDLLDSPSVAEATRSMTGSGEDAEGGQSLAMGAAVEAPWAGRLSAEGGAAVWKGHELAAGHGKDGGLLLMDPATGSKVSALPDGGVAEASYLLHDESAGWPSDLTVTVRALLSSKSVDLSITARNTGDSPAPAGLGWRPMFSVQGDRSHLRLRLPAQARLAIGEDGRPTGTMTPIAGTVYDFTERGGVALGSVTLHDTFAELRHELLESGPVMELTFPFTDLGVRMTSLTPNIRALEVNSPADAKYLIVAPETNYSDPFGQEWTGQGGSGMIVLQPGQSMEWKVRLEVFTPSSDSRNR